MQLLDMLRRAFDRVSGRKRWEIIGAERVSVYTSPVTYKIARQYMEHFGRPGDEIIHAAKEKTR